MTDKELIEKARFIYQHANRLKAYLLRGTRPERIWCGMAKDPSLPQIRVLLTLHMVGACRLKTLAQHLDISGASASEMVDRLVEMNMLSREQDPNDRRQVIIDLTPDARKRADAHEKLTLAKLTQLMEKLGPRSTDAWINLARDIQAVLESGELENGTKSHGKRNGGKRGAKTKR